MMKKAYLVLLGLVFLVSIGVLIPNHSSIAKTVAIPPPRIVILPPEVPTKENKGNGILTDTKEDRKREKPRGKITKGNK